MSTGAFTTHSTLVVRILSSLDSQKFQTMTKTLTADTICIISYEKLKYILHDILRSFPLISLPLASWMIFLKKINS